MWTIHEMWIFCLNMDLFVCSTKLGPAVYSSQSSVAAQEGLALGAVGEAQVGEVNQSKHQFSKVKIRHAHGYQI
jgi:hypothetical protein